MKREIGMKHVKTRNKTILRGGEEKMANCNYHDVDLVNPYADFAMNKKYWRNLKQRRVAGYVGLV